MYVPLIIPVIEVVGLVALVIVGELGPLMIVQLPLPFVGEFPFKEVVVTLHKF